MMLSLQAGCSQQLLSPQSTSPSKQQKNFNPEKCAIFPGKYSRYAKNFKGFSNIHKEEGRKCLYLPHFEIFLFYSFWNITPGDRLIKETFRGTFGGKEMEFMLKYFSAGSVRCDVMFLVIKRKPFCVKTCQGETLAKLNVKLSAISHFSTHLLVEEE